jgi:signal transduction histidine kinase
MKQLNRNVHRVLIAEPDDGVRRQLADALGDAYDVREAADGRRALEILRSERDLPDVIITDLELKGDKGLQVMVAAHSIDPHMPVLVVTRPEHLDEALEALRLGARDCIVKPLESVELVRYSLERAIEDRALPEEKERLQHELRDANRLKERLLRLVSEDFHQMIDEFEDYCRAFDEGSDDAVRRLARARHTARWMALRTEQVTVYGEIERYSPKMHPAPIALEEAARQALGRIPLDPALHRVEIAQGMPRVVADSLRLMQIFENLLVSAVQYSPDGGAIRVEAERLGEMVQCSVIDAGAPIPESLLPRVMEPFARQSRAKIPGVHSTGLGLSIARALVEYLGGRIRVENTDRGVALRFTLHPAG